MSDAVSIATDLLAGFPSALREAGLAIDSGRADNFLRATRSARLRNASDLARTGRVTLTGSPEDFATFDAVFETWFGAAPVPGHNRSPDEQQAPQTNPPRNRESLLELVDGDAAGNAAADDHLRNRRNFGKASDPDRLALARLKRRLHTLPSTESRKWATGSGPRIDMVQTVRAARRTFGETLRIIRRQRPQQPRRLLLLVDVSGSMKAQSETYMRFAHLLTRNRPKVETFCFGTRLSRLTKTLKKPDGDQALAGLSEHVFDFDGGTQIGASLEHFLSVSRYAALVRGAVTLVFSDGLERGDPARMVHSVSRLARLSHRLIWITPLAADPRYRPVTRAMGAVLPSLDALVDGSGMQSMEALLGHIQHAERLPRACAGRQYREPRSLP